MPGLVIPQLKLPTSNSRTLRKQRAKMLKQMLKRPRFSARVMERLTDAFQGCDRPCFDAGEEIGVISGTGYCNAAVAMNGLPSEGFRFQGALPLCETANYVGCQQGYAQAVGSVQGCLTYATGAFKQAYNEIVSQDCHVE